MKKTRAYRALALTMVLALVLAILGSTGPVAVKATTPPGVAVTVAEYPGNSPNYCPEGCGGHFFYRVDDPATGTYTDGFLSATFTVYDTDMGPTVSWETNFPVTCVVVKGGDYYNLYSYAEPVTGDEGLHSPQRCGAPDGGETDRTKYCGLSHIDFCYDIPLQVSKTAETSFTRTYTWDIDKSVQPDEWDLFCGDSGTSRYTVDVTRSQKDSNWAVQGTISIHNPAPIAAQITGVSDVVEPDITATCSGWAIDGVPVTSDPVFPLTLPAGSTLTGTYGASLPDGSSRLNVVTATTSGDVQGGEGTANVVFGDPTKEVGYKEVDVNDTYAGDHHFAGTSSWTYDRQFTCDDDCKGGTYENTATIVQTGQEDSAAVTVDCYQLATSKTANTTYTRQYLWDIEKTANPAELTLAIGQNYDGAPVAYAVRVWITGHVDSAWAVAGDITIQNPAPIAATINSVSDVISGYGGDVACDCGLIAFPYTLAAGGTLNCAYSADLPDGTGRLNTATVVQQNYDYDRQLNPTPGGTTEYTAKHTVSFEPLHPTIEIDECVNVSDTYQGVLGTACVGETLPKYFDYSRGDWPVYELCGDYEIPNTATLVANDTATIGSSTSTIVIHVPCEGCTLTQGYWKAHSKYGPAAHPDDTWDLLPSGPDTLFFKSGLTYYKVLWTPPSGGNAYYILAHQYIGAKLNMLNGASMPGDVLAVFNQATTLFNTYTPAQVASLKGKSGNSLRSNFLTLASTLDAYNRGVIGPGHCSE